MGKLFFSRTSKSYGHGFRQLGQGTYQIFWTVDTQAGRLRNPSPRARTTDRAGAERFAKRWGITIRELPKPTTEDAATS